jgi:arylsulfatase A-like enzyme
LLLAAGVVSRAQGPSSPARPNVILIITDDAGYGDFGMTGAPDVRTPHLDRLARDGVRLTDFYANATNCSPTRAALVTGRYQQRFAIETPLASVGPALETGLPVTGTSLPALLKSNGYRTALFGKWHLGYKSEFSPMAHGFEHFFGFKTGFIDYYRHTDAQGDADLFENDKPIAVDGYMTDLITARSVAFIEASARARQPFFVEVAYNAPHWPFQPPDRPSVAPENGRLMQPHEPGAGTRTDYAAMVERADRGVGEIVAAVGRLGLERDTLIIFTNDNGGEWLSRSEPFFHHKWTLWEGGIRVPTIVRWTGRIPAGQVSSQVGMTMDLTASILAATTTPVPAAAKPDGINLLPTLERKAPEAERTLFWRTNGAGHIQKAVRSGDWKLLIDGDTRYASQMIFNLRTDPSERHNLARERQDVAQKLKLALDGWEKDVDSDARAATGGGR